MAMKCTKINVVSKRDIITEYARKEEVRRKIDTKTKYHLLDVHNGIIITFLRPTNNTAKGSISNGNYAQINNTTQRHTECMCMIKTMSY